MRRHHPIFKSTLEDKTIELLDKNSKPLLQISRDTGLSETWLQMFGLRQVKHPSVGRVQTLYEYLSGKSLRV